MITFYTTHCPKCAVLKSKLDKAGIEYEENSNVDEMIALGLKGAPALGVEGEILDFGAAVKWVKEASNGSN